MPDNTVDDIIKNGTKDYCSPLYAAEMYAKGLCPLSDVEAAIRSAIEARDKRIASLQQCLRDLRISLVEDGYAQSSEEIVELDKTLSNE